MALGLRRGTVAVEAHDGEWETTAAKTIEKLKDILKDTLIDAQHVGSTAVRDIYAKPIIDIAAGVSDLTKLLSQNQLLEENGFIFRGQDHPGQYLYVCGDQDHRTHHIHAVIYPSEEWNGYVDFRDYLNCHKDDADAYSELKRSLAKQYPNDRKTYTAMKGEFISAVLKEAKKWRQDQKV